MENDYLLDDSIPYFIDWVSEMDHSRGIPPDDSIYYQSYDYLLVINNASSRMIFFVVCILLIYYYISEFVINVGN
jgi:hypothetical protein